MSFLIFFLSYLRSNVARAKEKTVLRHCQKMCIRSKRSFENYGKTDLDVKYFVRKTFGFTFYT